MSRLRFTLILMTLSFFVNGQMKLKWITGNFNELQDQHSIKVVFNYDSLVIDKHKSHQEYIDFNKREEESYTQGAGELWERLWQENLKNDCEPKFLELFQKYCGYDGRDETARYMLVVYLKRFITRNHGWIDGEFCLVDRRFPHKKPSRMAFTKVPCDCVGRCDLHARIAEGYAKAGKSIGQYIGRVREGTEE